MAVFYVTSAEIDFCVWQCKDDSRYSLATYCRPDNSPPPQVKTFISVTSQRLVLAVLSGAADTWNSFQPCCVVLDVTTHDFRLQCSTRMGRDLWTRSTFEKLFSVLERKWPTKNLTIWSCRLTKTKTVSWISKVLQIYISILFISVFAKYIMQFLLIFFCLCLIQSSWLWCDINAVTSRNVFPMRWHHERDEEELFARLWRHTLYFIAFDLWYLL